MFRLSCKRFVTVYWGRWDIMHRYATLTSCSPAARPPFFFTLNNSSHVNWPLHIAGILPGIRCILDAIDFPYNIFFIKGFSIYFDCSRTGRWIYHCQTYKIVFLRTIERPLFASCWFLLDSNLLFFHLLKKSNDSLHWTGMNTESDFQRCLILTR